MSDVATTVWLQEHDFREAVREQDLLCSVVALARYCPGRLPQAGLDAVLAGSPRRLIGLTTPAPRTG